MVHYKGNPTIMWMIKHETYLYTHICIYSEREKVGGGGTHSPWMGFEKEENLPAS